MLDKDAFILNSISRNNVGKKIKAKMGDNHVPHLCFYHDPDVTT